MASGGHSKMAATPDSCLPYIQLSATKPHVLVRIAIV